MLNDASVTRRGLITAGAALAAATAFAPVVASADEVAWTDEADILVIGAGGAGMSACIEARDLGLSIIALESLPYTGGSSRLCNGGMSIPGTPLQEEQGIEDSPELFFEDLMNNTQSDNNPDWLRLHCEMAADLWPWLTNLGVEFKAEGLLPTQGQSVPREHHVAPASVCDILETAALDRGAQIILETHADRFVLDETGRVIGVVATGPDGEVAYKGSRGVILATNGYSRNPEMINEWVLTTGAEGIIPFTGLGDDGSGLNMAFAIGAAQRHMGCISLLTGQNPDGAPGQSCSLFHGGGILVNQEGERFVDESLGYGNVWDRVAAQTDGYCWDIWDNDIAEEYAENDSSLYSMAKLRSYDGLLIEAETLEELAEKCELPAETLVATVEKYNADVTSTGVDSLFGRAHKISQVGEPPAIDNPPFFAWKTCNVLYGTTGGLKVDLNNQPVNVVTGEAIPGLYCAGSICTYAQMGRVPGTIKSVGASGCGFGGAVIWGRYAVQRINEATA